MENSWLHFGTKFGTKSPGQSKKIPNFVPNCPKMEPRFWSSATFFTEKNFFALKYAETISMTTYIKHFLLGRIFFAL